MIPKKIHYCWFGRGEKPKLAQKCIASWRKYCPDYEIIEWNEDNFDVNYNEYTRYCYENRKWAFLTDYVRLLLIHQHGGIYFDTDVELIKSPNGLLDNDAYFGFENSEFVNTGLGFGAVANHPVIEAMMERYSTLTQNPDGSFQLIGCPILNTETLVQYGLVKNGKEQNLKDNVIVFPIDYFNPLDDATGILSKTANTYSINHYGKSWLSKKSIIRSKLARPLHRLFGNDFLSKIKGKD
ncbi:MAG: glycosyl transferase [Ruminococcus sp.]|nr:glycosyl transferase [Ruminococcus sp.]